MTVANTTSQGLLFDLGRPALAATSPTPRAVKRGPELPPAAVVAAKLLDSAIPSAVPANQSADCSDAPSVVATGSGAVSQPAPAPAPAKDSVVDSTSSQLLAQLSDDGVLIFDVETTGTDKRRDQVIELCVQFGVGTVDKPAVSRTWRIRPHAAMNPGAQAVHGISVEDLADCPTFAECADEIAAMFAKATVLIGYNLSFDIDMIQAEYERLSRPLLDLSGKTIVDPFRLWQQCEPRSLQHAHRRFVGEDFAAAHSAEADVAATGRVLTGMLTAFGLGGRDWNAIADVCDPQRALWVGSSRHIQWDKPCDTAEAGATVIIGFGKHAGRGLHQLAREDGGYLRWLMDKDFPIHVQELCRAALEKRSADEFHAWVKTRFSASGETNSEAISETTDRPTV